MPLIHIENDTQFVTEINNQGVSLVVVDFFANWCGPCKVIAPKFEELSRKYPRATFMKVDVEKCQETAALQSVTSLPSFIFYRNKAKLDRLTGADAKALEEKIIKFYGDAETNESDEPVPGHISLTSFLLKSGCEALNESDDHPFSAFLERSDSYLESDCDPQLILSFAFLQAVKIHSIKIKAPKNSGPKLVKLFINQPTTLDFDGAANNMPTQELQFTVKDLEGSPVSLRYVKFQNVQNLQIFVQDNQTNSETTRIDDLVLYGLPVQTTNMDEFKRVAGKKGEAH